MFVIKCDRCLKESEMTDEQMKHAILEDIENGNELKCPFCGDYDVFVSEYPAGLSNSSTIDEIEKYLGIV